MIDIMWFRRDLRVSDNIALFEISKLPSIAAIFIYDNQIMNEPDFSFSHKGFIDDSVSQLEEKFLSYGGHLNIYNLPSLKVFESIQKKYDIKNVYSNHETGNWVTFNRDKILQKYFRKNKIKWMRFQTNGVIPDLKNRDGWSGKWNIQMNLPIVQPPNLNRFKKLSLTINRDITDIHFAKIRSIRKDYTGGETSARSALELFLNINGQHYSKNISSPSLSKNSCSRLGPFLTYGNISVRQIFQATKKRQAYLRELKVRDGWLKSLSSFSSRLRWHCHFIQKLDMQPNLEFTNMVRAFDNLRTNTNEDYFTRWKNGEVGYPMVDACMRFLKTNGWINFRMRAMLVSFASYNLWIDWRKSSKFLSKYFIDYEPGIHYNQFQMQSGVTGMNAIRIYNPIKQQRDHDQDGSFVKKWCPELQSVPLEYLQYPHLMSEARQKKSGCIIGKSYPNPVVDLKISSLKARKLIYDVKGKKHTKEESAIALRLHGSRKKNNR